jgi:hypothetical protein
MSLPRVRFTIGRLMVALLFAWLAGYFALMLDPLGVLYWYMD